MIHPPGRLEPWPRLFQNLRASSETELAAEFPIHTVTAWLGNTPMVAMSHYLTVREDDFRKAAGALQKAVQNPVRKAVQYPVLQATAQIRTTAHRIPVGQDATPVENRALHVLTTTEDVTLYNDKELHQLTPRGFEPLLPG